MIANRMFLHARVGTVDLIVSFALSPYMRFGPDFSALDSATMMLRSYDDNSHTPTFEDILGLIRQ